MPLPVSRTSLAKAAHSQISQNLSNEIYRKLVSSGPEDYVGQPIYHLSATAALGCFALTSASERSDLTQMKGLSNSLSDH